MVKWPELCGRGARLVERQAAVRSDEELDAEDANNVEFFEHAAGDLDGFARGFLGDAGRPDGDIENVAAMLVLDRPFKRRTSI